MQELEGQHLGGLLSAKRRKNGIKIIHLHSALKPELTKGPITPCTQQKTVWENRFYETGYRRTQEPEGKA